MDAVMVKPGQVYHDKDPRSKRRFVVVSEVIDEGTRAIVHRCKSDGTERLRAYSKIRVERLSRSGDYALVKDV